MELDRTQFSLQLLVQRSSFVLDPSMAGISLMAPANMSTYQDGRTVCAIHGMGESLMRAAMSQLQLSARAHHRVLKLARTIADLVGVEQIGAAHQEEALQYCTNVRSKKLCKPDCYRDCCRRQLGPRANRQQPHDHRNAGRWIERHDPVTTQLER